MNYIDRKIDDKLQKLNFLLKNISMIFSFQFLLNTLSFYICNVWNKHHVTYRRVSQLIKTTWLNITKHNNKNAVCRNSRMFIITF